MWGDMLLVEQTVNFWGEVSLCFCSVYTIKILSSAMCNLSAGDPIDHAKSPTTNLSAGKVATDV